MSRLGNNKGCGRDQITCELRKDRGGVYAVKQHEIERRIVSEKRWALSMKGGRIVDVYKKKATSENAILREESS